MIKKSFMVRVCYLSAILEALALKLSTSRLLDRFSQNLCHTSSPFCSGYFRDRVLLFAQAGLDLTDLLYASDISGVTGT
jgi:hypothetical protein